MDTLREYHRQELRCRQLAMYDSAQAWKWLAEAEMWEHKAHQHRAGLAAESNATSFTELANFKAA
jgi:hypothetical protein